MHSILASDLSPKERYFYLIGGIGPRPIAWVSTISTDGVYNLAPFSFFNAFSSNPPVVIFSPARSANPDKPYKDTYTNLVETEECVVQMVSYDLREQMKLSAQELDANEDEFKIADLTAVSSDIVKAPRVKESPFQMECKLIEMKNLGDQPGSGNLAICEVLKFHIDPELFKPGTERIDPQKIDLIGRNGEYYYTRASGEAIFQMK